VVSGLKRRRGIKRRERIELEYLPLEWFCHGEEVDLETYLQ
jgi:hypothetical protein